jgi:hypothetical protein
MPAVSEKSLAGQLSMQSASLLFTMRMTAQGMSASDSRACHWHADQLPESCMGSVCSA